MTRESEARLKAIPKSTGAHAADLAWYFQCYESCIGYRSAMGGMIARLDGVSVPSTSDEHMTETLSRGHLERARHVYHALQAIGGHHAVVLHMLYRCTPSAPHPRCETGIFSTWAAACLWPLTDAAEDLRRGMATEATPGKRSAAPSDPGKVAKALDEAIKRRVRAARDLASASRQLIEARDEGANAAHAELSWTLADAAYRDASDDEALLRETLAAVSAEASRRVETVTHAAALDAAVRLAPVVDLQRHAWEARKRDVIARIEAESKQLDEAAHEAYAKARRGK